jgi:hypothetical protein
MMKNPIKPSSPVCSTRKLRENPKLFIKGHALSLYFPSSIINMKNMKISHFKIAGKEYVFFKNLRF